MAALEREVATRRMAEQRLAEREQQMDLIEQLTATGSWEYDMTSNRIVWSREQLRIHGLPLDQPERTEADFLGLVHPDDRQRVIGVMSQLVEKGEPFYVEYRIVRPDGQERLLQAPGRLVPGRDGRLTRMIGTSLDITERRATELALQASEENYRTIFDASEDAIFVHDLDTGAVLEANRRACEMFEATLEEVRSSGMAYIANGPAPFTPDRALAHMQRAAAGEPVRFEWMILHPRTRREMWMEVSLQRVSIRGVPRLLGLVRNSNERKAAEQALRRSEESYRTIFRHASDAMWLHDVDTGAFIEVNDAACEVFGRTAEETKAMGVGGLSVNVPPFTLEDGMRYIQRAAAGQPQRFEWLGLHRDGHDVWLEMRLRRVTIDGIDRILATGRDINDLKAAEAALRSANEALERRVSDRTAELAASNAALAQEVAEHAHAKDALLARTRELEGIFQALPDLYFRIDAEQTVLDYRAGKGGGSYLSAEATLGRRLRDILQPDVCDRMDEALAAAPDALATVEYRLTVAGEERDHETRFFPLGDGTRIALVRDITERMEAERVLRDREEHFRRIIENTSDFVMIVDEAARITYVGPSATRMLGYATEEMMGNLPSDLVHPDDVPQVMTDFAWVLAHPGEPYTSTFRIRHKDGSYRVFENLGRTLSQDSAGEGVVAFGRDVTERKVAEASLARAKEEAERANRAKSEFLSRMSHELRTPMNSILGFAQLLSRAELTPQHSKSIQHILKAGRHLLHLINEVLEIARIEAGRENFSLEPVALGPVLREAMGLVRPLAQQHGVSLEEDIWPNDAFGHADRQRLVQVLLNLLSNAIKYNRTGGRVRVACVQVAGEPNRWAVRVIDSGRGIPANRVDQLFTPFARLGAEQTDVEGTGLGLALSRRLCEAMGGELVLESSDADGSVFRIGLEAADNPLHALEDSPAAGAINEPHRAATLLYIEDNLANLSLVETILLSRPGWQTIPALQGQLGVELAREHVPDVILLDLHLPDIPGEEVLRRLRADARTATIPVIVVSADATPASLQRLILGGANAYLTKPLDVDDFLREVERFLPDERVTGRHA
ncbi:MAG: sensor protein [Gemmatimonadetes bacterium]|nr:sensor protein [Gemmatimonadota bacterium]